MRTKIFNIFISTLCLLLCTVLLVGCDNQELTEYEEDVYDANGNLQITFFGRGERLRSPLRSLLQRVYLRRGYSLRLFPL